MINAGEPVIVCPYNKAHSIIQSRMQFHLTKCRPQNPNSEMATCPFNSTHIVPKVELEFHESTCEGRYLIEGIIYKVGNTRCPVEPVPMNVPRDQLAPDNEDWDSEKPCPPVLLSVQKNLEEKLVVVHKVGAPKSERKAHRVKERLRFQRVADQSLQKKKANEESEAALKSQVKLSPDDPNVPSCSSSIKQQLLKEDPNIPSCSSSTKKQIPPEDPNVASCSYENKKPAEDDFEVVNYRKNQGKKVKSAQTQGGVGQPLSNTDNKTNAQDVTAGMSQLKINKTSEKLVVTNPAGGNGAAAGRVNKSNVAAATPVGNAWNRALNMGGRGRANPSRPLAMEEFPSLPISGRGRGVFLLNNSAC